MAKGTVTFHSKFVEKVVEKVIMEEQKTRLYHLELTEDELKCLHDVLYKVGGSPYTSRRNHVEDILAALQESFANTLLPRRHLFENDTEGSIMFKDNKEFENGES